VLSTITLTGVRGFKGPKEISFRDFSLREIQSGGGKTSLALILDLIGRLLDSRTKEITLGEPRAYRHRDSSPNPNVLTPVNDPFGTIDVSFQRTASEPFVSRKITLYDQSGTLVTKFARFSEHVLLQDTKIQVVSEGDSVTRPMTHFTGLSTWRENLRSCRERVGSLIGPSTLDKVLISPWEVPGQTMTLARMASVVLSAPSDGGIVVFDAPALASSGYGAFMEWVNDQASGRPLPQIILLAPYPLERINRPWRWHSQTSW
jgi:hypothetical protein